MNSSQPPGRFRKNPYEIKRHLDLLKQNRLIRGHCPATGHPLDELDTTSRKKTLSNERGLHIKIAGLDFTPPTTEWFKNHLENKRAPIARDRRRKLTPSDPPTIARVRSLDDRPKVNESLDQIPPLPQSHSSRHKDPIVQLSGEELRRRDADMAKLFGTPT